MLGRAPRPSLLGEVPVAASNAELETRVKHLEWASFGMAALVVFSVYKALQAGAWALHLDGQLRRLVVAQPRRVRGTLARVQSPRGESSEMRRRGLTVRRRSR